MENLVTSILTVLTTGGALYYGTQKFFKSVEEHLTQETKFTLTTWILSSRISPRATALAEKAEIIFDSFFGQNHWTWKCFIKSTACSLLVFIIPFILMMITILALGGFDQFSIKQWNELLFGGEIAIYFFILPLFNILPDYLSLWKSRKILAFAKNSRAKFGGWIAAGLDFFLSYLIAAIPVTILFAIISAEAEAWATGVDPGVSEVLQKMPSVLVELSWELGAVNTPAAAVALVWLWIFLLGRLALRISYKFDAVFNWFTKYLNIQEKPLQCIGIAAGALIASGYCIMVLIGWVALR